MGRIKGARRWVGGCKTYENAKDLVREQEWIADGGDEVCAPVAISAVKEKMSEKAAGGHGKMNSKVLNCELVTRVRKAMLPSSPLPSSLSSTQSRRGRARGSTQNTIFRMRGAVHQLISIELTSSRCSGHCLFAQAGKRISMSGTSAHWSIFPSHLQPIGKRAPTNVSVE